MIRAVPAVKDRPASIPGALLSMVGLGSLIAGLTVGSEAGWTVPLALILLAGGVVLLGPDS